MGTAPGYGEVYHRPSFARQSIHLREIVCLEVFPPCGVVSRATASQEEPACHENRCELQLCLHVSDRYGLITGLQLSQFRKIDSLHSYLPGLSKPSETLQRVRPHISKQVCA